MSKGYNGWTNYETWNVARWLGNDEGLYRAYTAELERAPFTAESLAELVMDELLPNGTPDFDGKRSRYTRVNWQEIADNLNDERDMSRPGAFVMVSPVKVDSSVYGLPIGGGWALVHGACLPDEPRLGTEEEMEGLASLVAWHGDTKAGDGWDVCIVCNGEVRS